MSVCARKPRKMTVFERNLIPKWENYKETSFPSFPDSNTIHEVSAHLSRLGTSSETASSYEFLRTHEPIHFNALGVRWETQFPESFFNYFSSKEQKAIIHMLDRKFIHL